MANNQKKDPVLAGILSFIFPGIGQIYCNEMGKAVGFILAGLVGYTFFIIPGIIVTIFSIIDANKSAKIINQGIENSNLSGPSNKINDISNQTTNDIVTAFSFIEKLNKLLKLYKSEMLTESEYKSRKNEVITNLVNCKIAEEPEDFLSEIVILKEEKVLSNDEIDKIKRSLFR